MALAFGGASLFRDNPYWDWKYTTAVASASGVICLIVLIDGALRIRRTKRLWQQREERARKEATQKRKDEADDLLRREALDTYHNQTLVARIEHTIRKSTLREQDTVASAEKEWKGLSRRAAALVRWVWLAPLGSFAIYLVLQFGSFDRFGNQPGLNYVSKMKDQEIPLRRGDLDQLTVTIPPATTSGWYILFAGVSVGILLLTGATVAGRLANAQLRLMRDAETRITKLEQMVASVQIAQKHGDTFLMEIGAAVSLKLLEFDDPTNSPKGEDSKPNDATWLEALLQKALERAMNAPAD